jgi:hypothetical protein
MSRRSSASPIISSPRKLRSPPRRSSPRKSSSSPRKSSSSQSSPPLASYLPANKVIKTMIKGKDGKLVSVNIDLNDMTIKRTRGYLVDKRDDVDITTANKIRESAATARKARETAKATSKSTSSSIKHWLFGGPTIKKGGYIRKPTKNKKKPLKRRRIV